MSLMLWPLPGATGERRTSERPTVGEVLDKLQALGSARQIAQFLASERIVGLPGARTACPLANYLRHETDEEVCVGTTSVVIGWHPRAWIDTKNTPVQDFVHQFDLGQYPELIGEDNK